MRICPVCNGFNFLNTVCPNCSQLMEDKGRLIDFFDDYSPYMEIEGMKKMDGYAETRGNHECAHVAYCMYCHHEEVVLIKE